MVHIPKLLLRHRARKSTMKGLDEQRKYGSVRGRGSSIRTRAWAVEIIEGSVRSTVRGRGQYRDYRGSVRGRGQYRGIEGSARGPGMELRPNVRPPGRAPTPRRGDFTELPETRISRATGGGPKPSWCLLGYYYRFFCAPTRDRF